MTAAAAGGRGAVVEEVHECSGTDAVQPFWEAMSPFWEAALSLWEAVPLFWEAMSPF